MKTFKMSQNLYEELSEEEMIERYKPLIKSKAYYWHNYYCKLAYEHVSKLDLLDFEQEGYITIIKTYRDYDISYDNLYYTHLLNNVDNYMKRLIRDTLKLRREGYSLIDKKTSSIDESFSLKDNGNKEISLIETISDNENEFENIDNKLFLNYLLEDLTDRERKIINDYYYNNMTQVQISNKHNITQVQVSRILKKSINKAKLKLQKNNKSKGEPDMGRLNEDQLKRYLLNNANDDISVSNLIKKYCDKYNIPQSTVFTALTKRMPVFYDRIKAMCKKSLTEKNSKVNYSVIVNVEDAKEFLKDKVENEKYSLNKALQEYSKRVNVSISTIRNYIIREDKEFMEKIKASSLANLSDQYKAIAVNNNPKEIDIETPKENNIMPVDIVNNPFDPYEDLRKPIILTEKELLPITKNNEDELISLLKDLKEAKVSFDGKLFSYSIGNCGIKICDQDGRVVSNGIMHLEDIENLINELEKVAKITKSLF